MTIAILSWKCCTFLKQMHGFNILCVIRQNKGNELWLVITRMMSFYGLLFQYYSNAEQISDNYNYNWLPNFLFCGTKVPIIRPGKAPEDLFHILLYYSCRVHLSMHHSLHQGAFKWSLSYVNQTSRYIWNDSLFRVEPDPVLLNN